MDFKEKQFTQKKGPRGERVLISFLKEKKENELKNLIATDKALKAADKQKKVLEMQRQQAEADQRAMENEINVMKNAHHEMERNFQANMAKQKAEFEEQSQKEKEELKRQFDALMENQKATLEAGFKEEADVIKQELQDARRRMEEKDRETSNSNAMMERMFTMMKDQNEAHMKNISNIIANMPRPSSPSLCS